MNHKDNMDICKRIFPALALALLLLTVGCGDYDRTVCSSHAECRVTFGIGSTCLDGGYCSAPGIRDKEGETIPEACKTPESDEAEKGVFPTEAEGNLNQYTDDAVVVGVVARESTKAPIVGAELSLREFDVAAADSGLQVVGINCIVDDQTVGNPVQRMEEAAKYLTKRIGANAIIVSGTSADIKRVKGATVNSGATVFGIARMEESIFGPRMMSTVPSRRDEIAALTAQVKIATDQSEALGNEFEIALLANGADFGSGTASGLRDSLEKLQDANGCETEPTLCEAESDDLLADTFFTCPRTSACTPDSILAGIQEIIDNVEQEKATNPQDIHILITPGNTFAAAAIGQALNQIANDSGLFQATIVDSNIKSITLSNEAFDKESYSALSGLDTYNKPINYGTELDPSEEEFLLRGISPAGEPTRTAYQNFRTEYGRKFSTGDGDGGLARSPLVAHAADAAWLALLGYAELYFRNGQSVYSESNGFQGFSNDEVREAIQQFLDAKVCDESENTFNEERCNVEFPRLERKWNSLEAQLGGGLHFQMVGASGPLRFTERPDGAYILKQGYFTSWTINNPDNCLKVGGGSKIGEPPTDGGNTYCSLLSLDPARYTLYPILP